MPDRLRDRRPLSLYLVLVEMALATAIIAVGGWVDRESRAAGPEAPVMAYAAAIARGDLAGALDQLAPDLRAQAAPFVAWQLGNRYTILESAVRGGSILDRLSGRDTGLPVVSVAVEVRNEDGALWRATEELPVAFVAGRWQLLKPPLEPPPGEAAP